MGQEQSQQNSEGALTSTYSHATVTIDFRSKKKKKLLDYVITAREEGSDCLFRFSEVFSVNVLK